MSADDDHMQRAIIHLEFVAYSFKMCAYHMEHLSKPDHGDIDDLQEMGKAAQELADLLKRRAAK